MDSPLLDGVFGLITNSSFKRFVDHELSSECRIPRARKRTHSDKRESCTCEYGCMKGQTRGHSLVVADVPPPNKYTCRYSRGHGSYHCCSSALNVGAGWKYLPRPWTTIPCIKPTKKASVGMVVVLRNQLYNQQHEPDLHSGSLQQFIHVEPSISL